MSKSIALQTMRIGATEIPVLEYQGQRVVTFAMIDQVHQRPEGTAGRNFRESKHRFKEGSHYFHLSYQEVKMTGVLHRSGIKANPQTGLIVLTGRGYLIIAKSFRSNTEITQPVCRDYFQDYSMNFTLVNAYESEFGQILKNALNGLVTIDTQVKIKNYRVDFLIREYDLIIEYDEEGHASSKSWEKDRERERVLISLGYKIIRVKKKEPIGNALNKVLTVLWKSQTHLISC